jgi:hypothetical protein
MPTLARVFPWAYLAEHGDIPFAKDVEIVRDCVVQSEVPDSGIQARILDAISVA